MKSRGINSHAGMHQDELDQLTRHAIKLHRAKKLTEAASIYRQILSHHHRKSCNCANLLSLILCEQKQFEEAEKYINQAIEWSPRVAAYYRNRANLFIAMNRSDSALLNFQHATELKPDFSQAFLDWGNALLLLKRYNAAIKVYQKLSALKPNANNYNRLAHAYLLANEAELALSCFKKALEQSKNNPNILSNIGIALTRLGRAEEGILYHKKAIYLNHKNPKIYSNLGNAYQALRQFDKAEKCFEKALAIAPHYCNGYNNLGVNYQTQGKFKDAENAFKKALAIDTHHPESQFNLALVSLIQGKFEIGWALYESRFKMHAGSRVPFKKPVWQGGPLQHKRLLIYAEQGLGDTIQFSRYIASIKKENTRIIMLCQPSLIPLFEGQIPVDHFVKEGISDRGIDCQVAITSLPFVFKTRLNSIPASAGYLTVPKSQKVIAIDRKENKTLHVGLVWGGSKTHQKDDFRSIPLNTFRPLLSQKKIQFYSLQCDDRSSEIEELHLENKITDLKSEIEHFGDTAAILSQLDLVITVDTAIAHLAGSMGIPTWILITASPDFRWLLDRKDSPWYDSVKLFRQSTLGEWRSVIADVSEALDRLSSKAHTLSEQKPNHEHK